MTVARHMLLAHGRMYQAIHESTIHDPRVGPVKQMPHFEPTNPDSEADRQAAENVDNFFNGFYLAGVDQGVVPPPVSQGEEVPGLKGTWDVIGLNHYSRYLVSGDPAGEGGRIEQPPEGAEVTAMGSEVYPEGFYRQIMRLAKYQRPIYITENGISTLDDAQRCRYLLRYLQQVHRAIADGADVRGYLQWTLVDNFEWAEGFAQKFGIVAMEPDTLRRIPKPSAYLCRDIAQRNGIEARLFQAVAAASPRTMPPPFSVTPTLAPSTWRSPASPRSWEKIS
jgi:beta-glucosidase